MAIYNFKEFLDIEDVAEYLRDKEVYDFNLSYEQDFRKLKEFLGELIINHQIVPVFYYDGLVKEGFELDDMCFTIKAWICINDKMVKDFFFDSESTIKTIDLNIKDYLKVYKLGKEITFGISRDKLIEDMDGFIFMDTNRYKMEFEKPTFFDEDDPLAGVNIKTSAERRMELMFEIIDDINKKKEEDPNIEIGIDDYKDRLPKVIKNDIWLNFNDLKYPKSQLDTIFNQPSPTEQLQAKDDIIAEQAKQIAELQANQEMGVDKELRPNSQNTVSKLLYALMIHGDFELDGTKQGNLNDRLVSLTNEKGVPVTEKFITSWLEYLNDKYYFKKGK